MLIKRSIIVGVCGAILSCSLVVTCRAAKLVVLEARGGSFKQGMSVDSNATITLKEGERLTVIGSDGKSVALKGPISGQPLINTGSAVVDTRQALAALVATRDARTSSIGAIRAGTAASPLPAPWLVDVSRSGVRCVLEGELPVWWRPEAAEVGRFTLLPLDRSWSVQFEWHAGQQQQAMTPLVGFEGNRTYLIRNGERDHAIEIVLIPKVLENNFVLSSWMLEKGCVQQADALIDIVRKEILTQ